MGPVGWSCASNHVLFFASVLAARIKQDQVLIVTFFFHLKILKLLTGLNPAVTKVNSTSRRGKVVKGNRKKTYF